MAAKGSDRASCAVLALGSVLLPLAATTRLQARLTVCGLRGLPCTSANTSVSASILVAPMASLNCICSIL